MMNETMAYLLGLIVGKGRIQRGINETRIIITIPHKAQYTDATHDVQLAVRASIADMLAVLEPFLGVIINRIPGARETSLSFVKPNNDPVIQELLTCCDGHDSWENMRIHSYFFTRATRQEIIYLLRGISDVTGHVRSSNYLRNRIYNMHRVYIEIPQNWFLVIDICNLLKMIQIPVDTIDWGHPNIRDGRLTRYNRGYPNFWKKEHQIKILANEFLPVGFNVIHKNAGLIELSNSLCETYRARHNNQDPSVVTHRFYWEINPHNSIKPPHPSENDLFIPEAIRGRHFNSWREIADALGYRR